MSNQKWDIRFLKLAREVSTWSKDSTQVGAVITKGNRIVSIGYNGFGKGVRDDKERYEDRDTKLKLVIHAEDNAILFAKQDLTGCTLYTYPMLSCSNCSAKVIQSGISRVVTLESDCDRWNFDWSLQQFREADIEVEFYAEQDLEDDFKIYCDKCGACGEEGCCSPDKCEELKYCKGYQQCYESLLDYNDKLFNDNEKLAERIRELENQILYLKETL